MPLKRWLPSNIRLVSEAIGTFPKKAIRSSDWSGQNLTDAGVNMKIEPEIVLRGLGRKKCQMLLLPCRIEHWEALFALNNHCTGISEDAPPILVNLEVNNGHKTNILSRDSCPFARPSEKISQHYKEVTLLTIQIWKWGSAYTPKFLKVCVALLEGVLTRTQTHLWVEIHC